ncbi:uncharacterized protein TRAVEDRAFT_53582 [Trametes versicolor FP-101664 SS1]|uniref:uncharacterized protein n=1 Tax=Trametes versicolor (strain FP-101664) TaxID=717944 RepID=UPI00046244DD|nr:uncharacterized protein TRAVEDRAFT_53582 [Trametes versicolor FP-101664 SS1]EIW52154.1 hypothetical protein TRAVEDRAFT_53582 [Trametes versicolor FP-101664 SS1]
MLEAAPRPTTIGPLLDTPPEIQGPDLGTTYGAMLLGTYVGLMLYGVMVYQTYRYWRLYPDDTPWIKALVCVTFTLETLHAVLCIVALYFHLVINYLNLSSLSNGHWSLRVLTPTTGYSLFLCQSFYAVRVYRIERRYVYRLLVGAAVISIICSCGFTTAATIAGLDAFEDVSWLVGAMYGFAVLADVSLAGTLVVILIRNRTGFKSTDSVLDTLVIYAINTGLLTSVIGFPCFVFSLIYPGNLIYVGIAIVGVKLYANSVLAVLNSHRSLSDRMHEDFDKADMASFQLEYSIRRPGSPIIFALKATQGPKTKENLCQAKES